MPIRSLTVVALAAVVALLLVAADAAAARWRWPVDGEVITPFSVSGDPFAAGQHRGIDIAAPAGAPVRAACTGRVRFAGRLPRRGRIVSVACGHLVATHLELGSIAVRRGEAVAAGMTIGSVAASHVQLGARRRGDRFGYVDPLKLLGAEPAPPLGAAPAPRRSRRPPKSVSSAAAVSPRRTVSPARRPGIAVWAGLALLAAGLPLGRFVARRRTAARRAAAAGVTRA